ncbi:hypothetical protein NM688_g7023 [Phlebia brevispora]|uniref:Uncharacterized protein n=1 Tax=Phlebia brevispora TaxID=194682 RepID=A0ACC1S9V7_9APHY|nr:hypothetical protein NM688_g7023 [Phlebia brevispora]
MLSVVQKYVVRCRMLSSILFLLISWAIFRANGISISPVLKEGDVTLLYHNEVDIPTAPSHLSALLLPSHSNCDAVSACSSLHETLLPTTGNQTFSDIVPLLKYQVFLGKFNTGQQFWIGSSGKTCRTISTEGVVNPAPCTQSLPVLCSQSAGFGAGPTAETQLTLQSNSLTVTGFRDLKTFKFLGIPYANAPARWTYPTAYTGPNTINATTFGPACVQSERRSEERRSEGGHDLDSRWRVHVR